MEKSLGEPLREVRSSKIFPGKGAQGFRQAYIEALCRLIVVLGEEDGSGERAEAALPLTIEARLEMAEEKGLAEVVLRFLYAAVQPELRAQTRAVVRTALKEYGGGLQEQQEEWRVGSPPYVRLQEEIDRIEEALEEVRP